VAIGLARGPFFVTLLWLFTLTLLTGGCKLAPQTQTAKAPKLNSERIQERFGTYGIEVIEQSEALRVSRLYSTEGQAQTTRTLAVVQFNSEVNPAISSEHSAITAGASIGTTFKQAGWEVEKQNMLIESVSAADIDPRLTKLLGVGDTQDLVLHVYRLRISKQSRSLDYANIAEIHDPAYLSVAEVQSIYSGLAWVEPAEGDLDSLRLLLSEGAQ
jgi:hypothetical protein